METVQFVRFLDAVNTALVDGSSRQEEFFRGVYMFYAAEPILTGFPTSEEWFTNSTTDEFIRGARVGYDLRQYEENGEN